MDIANTLGPAAWLNAACRPAVERGRRFERNSGDGRCAALVEVGDGTGLTSHLLLAEADTQAWQDVAVIEGRVEAMEWQGGDVLLALGAAEAVRVFSVFPGMRLRDAAGPGGLRWLRVSTRRSRR